MAKARRIAIVGAGLGGLAAAIALRRQGFEVRVYEQAPELAEFGAGINISPNSVKFFQAVGLADKLHGVGSEPIGLSWRDWSTGEIRNSLPFVDFEQRHGAKYYVVHRSDLHRLLSEAVPQASIALGKRCAAANFALDGDTVFAAATGLRPLAQPVGELTELGAVAANVLARAVARGIYEARALPFPGALPSWRDKFGT